MSSEPIDLEGMLREIRVVYERYGLPRGLVFVPDKLEITLERIEKNRFHLVYQESFSYLPDHVLNLALQTVVQLLRQSWLPFTDVTLFEKGVKFEMTADLPIILSALLAEVFIQKPLEDADFSIIINSAKKGREMFTNVSDLCWTWDENTAKRFNNWIQKLTQTMIEHPSMLSELEEITKKYTC